MTFRVVRFPRVGSTNDIALEAAAAGAPPGLVVVAGAQVRGKGRKARDWASPPGGLWATVLLEPSVPPLHAGLVPLAVGCACAEALDRHGVQARLRWPNDLMLGDRKLGGVLVESRVGEQGLDALAAGIGINVTNEPPLPHAARAADHAPQLTPERLLTTVLDRLAWYQAPLADGDAQLLCEKFIERAWGIGRLLLLDGEPCRPKEIAVDGALIIEREDGSIDVVRAGSLRLPDEPG